MGKYLPKKGKVRENNSCFTARVIFGDLSKARVIFGDLSKAQVIFADLSLLVQIFPHINHKLIKQVKCYISSDYFLYTCSMNKKVVPDFRHGENIHCDREIFPPPQLNYDISLPMTFLKIDV